MLFSTFLWLPFVACQGAQVHRGNENLSKTNSQDLPQLGKGQSTYIETYSAAQQPAQDQDMNDATNLGLVGGWGPDLVKRPFKSPYGEYAMVCIDKSTTAECTKYGYYCDREGNQAHKGPDESKGYWYFGTCDDNCECQDLNPKPNCLVGITGQSYCIRSESSENEFGVNVEGIQSKGTNPEIDTVNQEISEETDSQPVIKHNDLTDLDGDGSIAAGPSPFGEYAMVCVDKSTTAQCFSYGYYCDRYGNMAHKAMTRPGQGYGYFYICDDECGCHNLNPKPNCLVGITGISYCVRSVDEDTETVSEIAKRDEKNITNRVMTSDGEHVCEKPWANIVFVMVVGLSMACALVCSEPHEVLWRMENLSGV